MITSYDIYLLLRKARAYVVGLGNSIINKQKGGKGKCDDDFKKARLITALCRTLALYGQIIKRPTYEFSVATPASGSTVTITIDGVLLGSFDTVNSTAATNASEIADFINGLGGKYTAIANSVNVKIYAEDGSVSNEAPVSITVDLPMVLTLPSPSEFSDDGEDYISINPERCLTDEQIAFVMEKVKREMPDCDTAGISVNLLQNALALFPNNTINVYINGVLASSTVHPVSENVTINI